MKVDILIITYNDGKYIKKCIESILNQSYKNFNLIIVNDGSTDETSRIIKSFDDKRIGYHKLRYNTGNIAKVRNKAFKLLKSKWVFITDGDCHVHRDWLKEGISFIKQNPHIAGIEGQVIYAYDGYKKTLSDRYIENREGNLYCMANVAYRKELLIKCPLNEGGGRLEDRFFALSLIKYGHQIKFNKNMIVYHAIKKDTINWVFQSTKNVIPKIKCYKLFKDTTIVKCHIFAPRKLLKIIFPPLLLYALTFKVKTKRDFIIWLLMYPQLIVERFLVWKTAIKEKVFVI